VLDTEVVHAIAPGATIVELLVKGTSLDNIGKAVAASVSALRLGTSLGAVISISAAGQTGGEHCDTHAEVAALHAALRNAANDHVTVVAASGDIGAVGEPCQLFKGLTGGTFAPVKEANLPASDPLVLAAGGTTLTADHQSGAYIRESAWGLPYGDPGSQFQASGGGLSRVFKQPSYHAGRHLGFVNAALYRIGRSARYHQAFHDVTTGSNTVRFPPRTMSGYHAAPGWDPVTGSGSPNASVLVPLLARSIHPDDGKGL
jgi:subtilase family serine protease